MKRLVLSILAVIALSDFVFAQKEEQYGGLRLSNISFGYDLHTLNTSFNNFDDDYNSYSFENEDMPRYDKYDYSSMSSRYNSNPSWLGLVVNVGFKSGLSTFSISYAHNGYSKFAFISGVGNDNNFSSGNDTVRSINMNISHTATGNSLGLNYSIETPLIFRCMNFSFGLGTRIGYFADSKVEQKGQYYESYYTNGWSGWQRTGKKQVLLDASGTAPDQVFQQLSFSLQYELIFGRRLGLTAAYLLSYNNVNRLNYDSYGALSDGYKLGLNYHFIKSR